MRGRVKGGGRRVLRRAGIQPSDERRDGREGQPLRNSVTIAFAAVALVVGPSAVRADGPGDPAVAKTVDGKSFDRKGDPTYKVAQDGTVDW